MATKLSQRDCIIRAMKETGRIHSNEVFAIFQAASEEYHAQDYQPDEHIQAAKAGWREGRYLARNRK